VPRAIEKVFKNIKQMRMDVTLKCSFIQIYNEKIYDLLSNPNVIFTPLKIREDKISGIFVEGLSEYSI
jgi:hypothetical protein